MTKDQQTDKVFKLLYDLTKKFTKAYQPKYYYQFHGDVEDLAGDFFTQFITPKARSGEKKSLLDKFDEDITSLPYLVKVCVIRKLIDASRSNPQVLCSFDELLEKVGDLCMPVEHKVKKSYDKKLVAKVSKEFTKLQPVERNKIFVSLFDSDSPFTEYLTPALLYIHNCPVQQVTPKTVVLYVQEHRTCVSFDVSDGHPRGKMHPFSLTKEECVELKAMTNYHSQFSRELFEEYLQKVA